jgi:hypothetical protein
MDGYRVINGTHGSVWADGEEWAEVTAFQVKVAKNKSTITFCGQMTEDSKVTGVKITGSMTMHKIYTRGSDEVEQVQAGHDPRKTLVGALADPDAFGAERISVYGVSFDEVPVMDWAAEKEGSITIPFTATRVEYLDKIEVQA